MGAYPNPMTIFRNTFFALVLAILSVAPYRPAQAMDPKVKAVATMAAYGTVSGALLGAASLAFGTKGRSVAIGASVGLYAGLLFGTYVIVTHQMKQKGYFENPQTTPNPDNYYPGADQVTPYQPGFDGSGGGGLFDGFFMRNLSLKQMEEQSWYQRQELDRMISKRPDRPLLSFDLLRFQF